MTATPAPDPAAQFAALQAQFAAKLHDRVAEIDRLWTAVGSPSAAPDGPAVLHRLAHSLAGSAGTFGFPRTGDTARELEHLFEQWQRLGPGADPALRDRIRQTLTALRDSIPAAGPAPGPTTTPAAAPAATPAATTTTAPGAEPLILSVDDDEDIRAVITHFLAAQHVRVVTAESGEKALDVLKTQTPDLILTDVLMPGMDGYALCAAIQREPRFAYIPVIFLTRLDQAQDRAKAFAAGGAAYLSKPLDQQRLLALVQQHLQTSKQWASLDREPPPNRAADRAPAARLRLVPRKSASPAPDFARFKSHLAGRLTMSPEARADYGAVTPATMYQQCERFGLTPQHLAWEIAQFLNTPYLERLDTESLALGVLPLQFCRANRIVPVQSGADGYFALCNPFNVELFDALAQLSTAHSAWPIRITEPDNILLLLDLHGGDRPATASPADPSAAFRDSRAQLQHQYSPVDAVAESPEDDIPSPLIAFVNHLIEHAYDMGASDIHIEPEETFIAIRFRIDGHLRVIERLQPPSLIRPLVARLKIMSDLNIAERRLPQDGRIVFKKFTKRTVDFDLRVATAPMNFGEKVVMRILDKRRSVMPLDALGFSPENQAMYRRHLRAPYGMILHVGPTGSGKSMTLYAALNEMKSPETNIQTIEDPIEYTLAGINQMQVNRDIELDFKRGLRCFLRQDPDIILVGEIRDTETARIAVEASLTGHLLLSTLHTNDAVSTITRFIDMGVEPFLISSSLIMVCAQRLLRRLCPQCRTAYTPEGWELETVLPRGGTPPTLYRAAGCEHCHGIGYKGRIGIHEVLVTNDAFRVAIHRPGISPDELKRIAVEQCGMITLFRDALDKVRQGVCSLHDALTAVRPDDFTAGEVARQPQEASHDER